MVNGLHPSTLIVAAALVTAASPRFRWMLTASTLASALLGMASVARPSIFEEPLWLVFAACTVAIKCVLIPRILKEARARRQSAQDPRRGAMTLVAASALAALAYATTAVTDADTLGAALATALVGVVIAASRPDPLERALGLIAIANGAALAILALPSVGHAAFLTLAAIDLGVLALVLALREPVAATVIAENGSAPR